LVAGDVEAVRCVPGTWSEHDGRLGYAGRDTDLEPIDNATGLIWVGETEGMHKNRMQWCLSSIARYCFAHGCVASEGLAGDSSAPILRHGSPAVGVGLVACQSIGAARKIVAYVARRLLQA
jgi:hypothetical protein